MPCYFFSGNQYIRVTRGQLWPGTIDAGYPLPLNVWGWGSFGVNGIDAALSSGPVDYFFSGSEYIRVSRGATGPGTVDQGYPAPISQWGWGHFGATGIDAALSSDTKCYFFSGNQYIRVSRGDTGPGKVDPGYPAPISNWGWGTFGANGIDAALNSGEVDYFFSGDEYIRVTRGETGSGAVDPGYPKPISEWGWGTFGKNGIQAALWSGTDISDPLGVSGALTSYSNYFLANGCSPLTDVTVTIDLFEDLTFTENGPPTEGYGAYTGFTWQLNCFTSPNSTTGLHQFVIGLRDSEIIGQVDIFEPDGVTQVYNKHHSLKKPPNAKTIPAGYKLRIALENDANGNITSVNFIVYDNNGKEAGSKKITLPSKAIASIVAIQMVLVGPANGESVSLSSGSGTITYTASSPLTVSYSVPHCIEFSYTFTIETGNSSYGALSLTPSTYFQQSFGINGNPE